MHRFLAICLLNLTWAGSVTASPLYSITTLGLNNSEHIRSDGYKYSHAIRLNDSGQVVGYSQRYQGDFAWGSSTWLFDGTSTIDIGIGGTEHTRLDNYIANNYSHLNESGYAAGFAERFSGFSLRGQTAWLYNGNTTVKIGLIGAEHTRVDGYKFSSSNSMNDLGQVTGISERFTGRHNWGYSIWLYDGITTQDIGLVGSDHTRDDGYRSSSLATPLNAAGQVVGHSERFNQFGYQGQSVWLFNGATTIDIGLIGAGYTSTVGERFSFAYDLNESGQVLGRSTRFNGNSAIGSSVWLYDGVSTLSVGLVGTEHTRADGYKYNEAGRLNEAGQVTGHASRWNNSVFLGNSAWLFDGDSTVNIGPTGAEHTRSDGFRSSWPTNLNEAGQVTGYASRFSGSNSRGESAWFYNGSTTVLIGLTDAEHTSSNGTRSSFGDLMNDSGQVLGVSQRYNGTVAWGESVWLYDGAKTVRVGLTSADYTRADGYKNSALKALNNAGHAVGTSDRFIDGVAKGQDVWFYNPTLQETIPIVVASRSNGYAVSDFMYLGEDGLLLGTYRPFDALDNELADRAFYFTVEHGLHDLGLLVEDGLSTNGWELLAAGLRSNNLNQILGFGVVQDGNGSHLAFLLTPVPEPNTWLLSALFAVVLVISRHQSGTGLGDKLHLR